MRACGYVMRILSDCGYSLWSSPQGVNLRIRYKFAKEVTQPPLGRFEPNVYPERSWFATGAGDGNSARLQLPSLPSNVFGRVKQQICCVLT